MTRFQCWPLPTPVQPPLPSTSSGNSDVPPTPRQRYLFFELVERSKVYWRIVTMTTPHKPILRPSARLLLLNESQEVLLYSIPASGPDVSNVWITPGGGLKPGESYQKAAIRELYEETGLAIETVQLGPCVWKRTHVWNWNSADYKSLERFFLVTVPRFVPYPFAPEPEEADLLRSFHW